jgi:hypothetical protein
VAGHLRAISAIIRGGNVHCKGMGLYRITILLIWLAVAVLGCGIKFESPSDNIKVDQLGGESSRFVSVEALGEPHTYFVKLRLPADSKYISLVKRNLDAPNATQTLSNIKDQVVIDHEVVEGGRYSYEAIDSSTEEIIVRENIRIPRDFVYGHDPKDSVSEDSYKLEADRIFLLAKYPLMTKGANFEISAKQLNVETGAKIETFPVGQTAEKHRKGRSGGVISIDAEEIIGDLHIILRGENGGAATQPEPMVSRPPKKPQSPSSNVRTVSRCNGRVGECTEANYCDGEAVDGLPGAIGLKGLAAIGGFDGGDAGILNIKVSHLIERFSLNLEVQPGLGSSPGEPGLGGPGGEGGEPGATISPCTYLAKKGSTGPAGPKGEISDQWGLRGKSAQVCRKFPGSPGVCENEK